MSVHAGRFQYKPENIMVLTDDNPDRSQHPTKQNMINAMQWLIQDAKCHDSLFFHCEIISASWAAAH
jgi:hypothetical protein